MARYIDADKIDYTVTVVGRDENAGYRAVAFESDIDEMPTADVAPKSEVARLQAEVNRYKRYYFHHDYDEMIAEVLDELDRFINSNCIEIKDERGIKGYVTSSIHFAIAELKKKYTEEKE